MIRKTRGNADNIIENSASFIKEMIGGFMAGFMKSLTHDLVEPVKEEIAEFYETLKRNLTGMVLLIFGLVFLLVGLAHFLNDLIQISDGFGYALVGMVTIIFGFLTIKK